MTPEQPTYRGSDWHVEGALNEHICATALIYYDQSNISDSALEFRHEVDSETMIFKPGQDEWEAAEDMFGITHEGPAEQDLGKVLTRKGRILAFPNVMQHRVRSFGLADSSKPGYRKILAMFLVDPHIRILSTANVPPQRRDWWAEEVVKVPPFCDLPVELFERIIDNVEDFPMSWEQACEAREALMAERGRVNQEYQEMVAQVSSTVHTTQNINPRANQKYWSRTISISVSTEKSAIQRCNWTAIECWSSQIEYVARTIFAVGLSIFTGSTSRRSRTRLESEHRMGSSKPYWGYQASACGSRLGEEIDR